MDNLKLDKIYNFDGEIKCITGLMIGGYSGSVQIGGVDNPIIRNPITNLPYIPGSSIKGKMRSLYELSQGSYSNDGSPHSFKEGKCDKEGSLCTICTLYGTTADTKKIGPTRLLVRDSKLTLESKEKLEKLRAKTGMNYSEIKSENFINRLKVSAMPRQMERIPAGVTFNLNFVIRIFSVDNEEDILKTFKQSLTLLEMDSLGGSGSRGYGKVEIKLKKYTYSNSEEKSEGEIFYPKQR